MSEDKHPFDIVAERLEALADRPIAGRSPSPDYWELRFATDESVGDYPQALLKGPFDWGESEGLGPDGFPVGPIPELELQPTAHWTDVLSSSLWSEGLLFNRKALDVFQRGDLGQHREYPVIVRDGVGAAHPRTYLHVRNEVPPTAIDFGGSEFYLADMIGVPKGPVAIDSFEAWSAAGRRAIDGELAGCEPFSRIEYRRLVFRPGHEPTVDLFRLSLGIRVYISARLKNAIAASGISGLEIKPNRRLFAVP